MLNPPVVALKPSSFDAYCRSIEATPVASAQMLLAEPIKTARVWTLASGEPIPRHSRIVTVQGARQPSYDDAARVYPQSRQAFLRLRCVTVFPRTGLVMPEHRVVLRNDLREWVPDHRLTPGFVDFVDGAVMVRTSDNQPLRRIHQTALVLCHASSTTMAIGFSTVCRDCCRGSESCERSAWSRWCVRCKAGRAARSSFSTFQRRR